MNLLANSFCKPTKPILNDREIISSNEMAPFNRLSKYLREAMEKDRKISPDDLENFDVNIKTLSALIVSGASENEVREKVHELFSNKLEVQVRRRVSPEPKNGVKYFAVVEITVFAAINIVSTLIASIAGVYYSHHLAIEREEYLRSLPPPPFQRSTVNCTTMDYGCLNNFCWTSCGPRLAHRDYCLTTPRNESSRYSVMVNNQIAILKYCNNDQQCNPCWPCCTTCTISDA